MSLTGLLRGLALLSMVSLPGATWAARVSNDALRFSFAPPVGFEEAPPPDERVLYSYAKNSPDGKITVNLERLGRAIGKERVGLLGNSKKFQSLLGSKATTINEEMKWGKHSISVIRTNVENPEGKFVVIQAQVPLEPEAISVTVGGPLNAEPSIREALRKTVGSIEGESSWENNFEILKKLLVPALILLLGATWWLYIRYSKDA